MTEAEQILEQLGALSTRMKEMDTRTQVSEEDKAKETQERQDLLGNVEKLQNQLDEINLRGAGALGSAEDDKTSLEKRNSLNVYLRGNDLDEDQKRSLASLKDSDGGFLLSETQESGIVMNAFNPGEIESVVPVLPTGGNRAVIASMSKPKVVWGPKNITLTEDELSSGTIAVDIHSLRALVLIPNDTLADSAADIPGELNAAYGMALAEARDDAYAIGTGVNMPQGFMKNKEVLKNFTETGATGLLDTDALTTAIYALNKKYRNNATISCSSKTEGILATLKNAQGTLLWVQSLVVNTPNTFMGLRIINPESMDQVATGKFPVAIGDLASAYRIRERGSVTIQRLDEAFATSDQTAFLVKQRIGGQTALPEAIQLIKIK